MQRRYGVRTRVVGFASIELCFLRKRKEIMVHPARLRSLNKLLQRRSDLFLGEQLEETMQPEELRIQASF
jgi:hypothetical protein